MIRISEKGVEWTDEDSGCVFRGNKVIGGTKECCAKTSRIMGAAKILRESGYIYHVRGFDKQRPEVTFIAEVGEINPNTMGLVCQCGKHHA